jgi:hypothetical protein
MYLIKIMYVVVLISVEPKRNKSVYRKLGSRMFVDDVKFEDM